MNVPLESSLAPQGIPSSCGLIFVQPVEQAEASAGGGGWPRRQKDCKYAPLADTSNYQKPFTQQLFCLPKRGKLFKRPCPCDMGKMWNLSDYYNSHASMLHSCVSVLIPGHSVPPFWAGTAIVLFRCSFPPPQVTEQLVHSLHSDHSQLTEMVLGNSER